MEDQPNKQELLERIEAERRRWDTLIATLGSERMVQPGVVGQWSVKDMIAHLSAWQGRPIAWLQAVRDGTRPQPTPWKQGLTEEEINEWIWQTNRERPLPAVLDESTRTHQELMGLLRSTADEALMPPKRYNWMGERSIVEGIAANTYEHYQEHAAQIRTWLEATHVA